MKKFRLFVAAISIAIASFLSFGFVDNYFEISKNLDIFATLYKELNIYYVDDTKPGELIKTGIDAMLESLDPYTVYYPESDIEDYRFLTTGQYGGIGSLIRKNGDNIIIAEPYEGFPAYKAQLYAGDIILAIDGKEISGMKTSEVSKILKGQAKTEVTLKVKRQNEEFEKSLIREDIKIKDVPFYGLVDDGIGYIKLNGFTQTASKELKAAYKDLKDKESIQSLILDLRGNGGGLLNEAINIVNFFVNKGEDVVHTKGKIQQWDRTHKALNEPLDLEIPLIILIDRSSASASEIVSGAIQDLDRGVVIGRKSFGKGLVQQTRDLSYNSKLKVTVAKYYIPSGRCIQRIDYAHKNKNGKAEDIPDSLVAKFQTRNGRPVYDAGGIAPDIKIKKERASDIAISLITKNRIFEFATEFKLLNDSIVSPEEFEITEDIYNDFKKSLEGKDYDYETESEKRLKELKEATEVDKYYENISNEFELLKTKLHTNKASDLDTYKSEISEFLENEIISRYYYQTGRIKSSLKYDSDIEKAIEVLKDQSLYNSILAGNFVQKD